MEVARICGCVMLLVGGLSPSKRPLPVYISNPTPPRAGSDTGPLCFTTEQPFTPPFIYLLAHYSLTAQNLTCGRVHSNTHIMNTDHQLVQSHCPAESPTHPCEQHHPLHVGLPFLLPPVFTPLFLLPLLDSTSLLSILPFLH